MPSSVARAGAARQRLRRWLASREDVAAVVLTRPGSRWYATPVEHGHAVAWNPSLPGGAKAEDTYLVSPAGLERLTTAPAGTRPQWPAEDDGELPPRPAVLEVT